MAMTEVMTPLMYAMDNRSFFAPAIAAHVSLQSSLG